jgi:hypothetical protein
VSLYAGTRQVALHRDFTKLTMKLRPVNALPYFLFTPLVDGNNLDFDERRFEKEIHDCHGTRRAH